MTPNLSKCCGAEVKRKLKYVGDDDLPMAEDWQNICTACGKSCEILDKLTPQVYNDRYEDNNI